MPKIGTLGLDFFRDRVLLLDFPARRVAILGPGEAMPAWIEEQASWVGVDYREEKLFVPLTLAGETYDDFFYDTGSSLFPVSTTMEIWQKATGRRGDEPSNITWKVPSFGQEVVLIGAPSRGGSRWGVPRWNARTSSTWRRGPNACTWRTGATA